MRNNIVKTGIALSEEQSKQLTKMVAAFFTEIGADETTDILNELMQSYIDYEQLLIKEYGEKTTDYSGISEKHFYVCKLNVLLRSMSQFTGSLDSGAVSEPTPEIVSYEMDSQSMDDGKTGSIKKGENLECQEIDLSELHKGYVCLIVFKNGSREVVDLSSIDHENQMIVFSERNPINRTTCNFDEVDKIYLVLR